MEEEGPLSDIIYPDNNDFPSTAFPSGINDAGQVVGSIYNGGTGEFEHAFITGLNGVGTIELNFMPGTVDDPSVINPTDINNTGEVVGNIQRADGSTQIPFITGPDGAGATDLNSLVHMPAGIVLTQAIAINNLGYVIALSPVGPVSPVPEPSSYALMLAGLALINFVLRRCGNVRLKPRLSCIPIAAVSLPVTSINASARA